MACAKAKARCNNEVPSCGRCVLKGELCHYQGLPSPINMLSTDLHNSRRPVGHSTPQSVPVENVPPGSEPAAIDFNFPDLVYPQLDWSVAGVFQSDHQISNDQSQHLDLLPTLNSSAVGNNVIPQHNVERWNEHLPPDSTATIATMPSFDLRSFRKKPGIKGGAHTTATLMTQILTSYAGMMRDHASLPPFIHPSSLADIPGCETRSTESLTTCKSLMQLLGSGTPGSRKLVWKNVRLECERLYADVSTRTFLGEACGYANPASGRCSMSGNYSPRCKLS